MLQPKISAAAFLRLALVNMAIGSSSIRLYIYIADVVFHELAPPAVGAFGVHGDRLQPLCKAAGDVPADGSIDAGASRYG